MTTTVKQDFAKSKPEWMYLYRIYNKYGKLLYVGVAKNPHRRIAQHRLKSWGRQIQTVVVEKRRYKNVWAAESYLISKYQPIYNAAKNPKNISRFKRWIRGVRVATDLHPYATGSFILVGSVAVATTVVFVYKAYRKHSDLRKDSKGHEESTGYEQEKSATSPPSHFFSIRKRANRAYCNNGY